MQSYNTMLTLSHLSCVSDGIVLVENSTLNSTCQKVLKIARPSIHVSFVRNPWLGRPLGLYTGWACMRQACPALWQGLGSTPHNSVLVGMTPSQACRHACFDWGPCLYGAIAVCSLA